MQFSKRRVLTTSASVLAIALFTAGCGSSSKSSSSSASASTSTKSGAIGLLLPETDTTRYEAQDRPLFTAKVAALCPNCTVDYENANLSASNQLTQAQAELTKGVKVLVLDPVDATSAAGIVTLAKQANVPVISYDRLIQSANVDYYISFDNELVGKLQGQSLLSALNTAGTTKSGSIVMINGSPTDSNAALFKKGAHSVLDGQVTIGKEYDTPDWSAANAQNEMQQAITALGKSKIVGVYAANDGTAGGAYAAMKNAGFTTIPPLTGQDAQVDGIQRIIAGQQYMTVYKAIKPEAEDAATMAVDIVQGKTVSVSGVNFSTVNNGTKDVQSILLTPVAVTKANVESTVVKDGFLKVSDICTATYASDCTAAGVS